MKRAITSVICVISFATMLVLGLTSRVQAKECPIESIRDAWGFSCQGTVSGAPIASVGLVTLDGKGGLSGTETSSLNGTILTGVTLTGTYNVNPDCTASATSTTFVGSFNYDAVFVNDQKEALLIEKTPGVVIVCTLKKQ